MGYVLAVEDDHVIRGLLRINLEMEGHEVETAVDGREALDKIAVRHPDLVLLDAMLPNVSGWEVMERIRADAETRELPVILISARAMQGDIDRGLALGADRYVTKPFDPIDLMVMVGQLLAARGAA